MSFIGVDHSFNPHDPQALWNFALGHLESLRTSYGFNASDSATGLYAALFGRDSLWILMFLLETFRLFPSITFAAWIEAAGVDILTNLCQHQGNRLRDLTEEQPGKIPHECRQHLDQRLLNMEIAFDEQGCTYMGFDQTFLFVIAFRSFNYCFPDSPVTKTIWSSFERALIWIETYADSDGDGLFEYSRRNPNNILNQVWKDSFDSIVQTRTGFDIPPHPLAWVEVQAYAYQAFVSASNLYSERGKQERAEHFRAKATALRQRLNQFWLEDEGCLAVALDASKSIIRLISSNAAHALWAEILEPPRVEQLVYRLMQPDMLTSYGLRTLSAQSPFYAPFSYHRGNIWPFDNGVFVMGLLKYGEQFHAEALQVIKTVSQAIALIGTPIELYAVLSRELFITPPLQTDALVLRSPFPTNHIQGWTAATMLYFAAVLADLNNLDLSD